MVKSKEKVDLFIGLKSRLLTSVDFSLSFEIPLTKNCALLMFSNPIYSPETFKILELLAELNV
ncbi:hypothetical protein D3C73_683420 [compost metagenome]